MGLFIERVEKEDVTLIIYKRYPLFYILLIPFGILNIADASINHQIFNLVVLLIYAMFFLLYVVLLLEIYTSGILEVRKAMVTGKVKIYGSKFSFSKPFTYEIDKVKK